MWNINLGKLFKLLALLLLVEVLSYLSFLFPDISPYIFSALALVALGLSFYRLEYGLLLVLAELFVGSMGHLFYFTVGSYQVPLRIVLWGIVLLAYVIKFIGQLIKEKSQSAYWQKIKNWPLLKYFLLLFLFIIIALLNGLLHGHGFMTIFSDFNAWLYFLLLFPVLAVYRQPATEVFSHLRLVFLASALWLSLETLFILFAFTHNLSFTPDIYAWLRRTIVGEVTPTLSGWPRIFIQSQIYSALAFFLVFWSGRSVTPVRKFFSRQNLLLIAAAAWFLSAILISFSRSFWVGLAAALLFALILIKRFYNFSAALRAVFWLLASGAGAFLIIYLVAIFPYPTPGAFNADFLSRLKSQNDAAVASRWSLWPVLLKQIEREPFLGQGFGATVTYYSRDPRVLQQNPSGLYTTYAFEWGYLDLWLKLGIFGLLAYLFLLFKIMVYSWPKKGAGPNNLAFALATGVIFLAVTNIFTPFLNHPLGIGFLLLSSCLILADRVY